MLLPPSPVLLVAKASVPARPVVPVEEDGVPPVASSPDAPPGPEEDGPGRDGTWTFTISDQSFRLGSSEVWTRRYPSVAILATRRPNAGSGGPNWTERIAPVGPVRIPRSSHAREEEAEAAEGAVEEAAAAAAAAVAVVEGSSQIRIVRSWEHEARREPWMGWEKERWRMGASWACNEIM